MILLLLFSGSPIQIEPAALFGLLLRRQIDQPQMVEQGQVQLAVPVAFWLLWLRALTLGLNQY